MDLTTRLKLKKPAGSDDFKRADVNANWDILEAAPGIFLCTSTTRPTWLAAQAGMLIRETDTKRILEWTGTAWARIWPQVSQFAVGSGNTTLPNGSQTPLPGLSISVSPDYDTKYLVTASVPISTHAPAIVDVTLYLDTTPQPRPIHTYIGTTQVDGVYFQQWEVTVESGTHTLRLSGLASGNSSCSVSADGSLRVTEI